MKTILKAYHKNSDIPAYHKYEYIGVSNFVVICEETFDKNVNILTSKNSTGFSSEFTRDENGNVIAYKNSNSFYRVKGKKVSKEVYEEFIDQLNSKTLDGKEAEIEGRKYELKLIN